MSDTSTSDGLKATIHQPDFMPWLGFYKKISKADMWVILDHVENNPRSSGYWNRVKLLIQGRPHWDTVPIKKPCKNRPIGLRLDEFRIDIENHRIIKKKLESFRQSYGKAPHFDEAFELYRGYFESGEPILLKRNIEFIEQTLKILRINAKRLYSSELNIVSRSSQMLIDILKSVGACHYVHGDGASGYQDNSLFSENNISIEPNNFVHPEYPQITSKSFVPGLSVLDAIANIGSEGVRSILDMESA